MEVTRTMPLNRHTMALSAKSVDAVKGRAGVKTDTVLRIEHLSKNFGSHIVLRDIDFSVRSGEVVCIIGASGSGKSTMLRCINPVSYTHLADGDPVDLRLVAAREKGQIQVPRRDG